VQEVERQHYAQLRPDADLFLDMEKDDWASLNSSLPGRAKVKQADDAR
jgi:hypothetical protein